MLTALRILEAAERPLREPTQDERRDAVEHWWFQPSRCMTPSMTFYSFDQLR